MSKFCRAARVVFVALFLCISSVHASEQFSDLVGRVDIGPVNQTKPLVVPYIFWGGDIPTFYANGGLRTQPGTIFAKLGLDIELVAADDTVAATRWYVSGRTPFFRGTDGMAGMAAEVLGQNPSIYPFDIFQLTYSQGDHCVCRSGIRTIKDFSGKTFVLQQGGPHVKFLYDVLKDAGFAWNSVTVVWTKDLFGSSDSPAAKFKAQGSIDCAFVVTPDMIGLTGGLQTTGGGGDTTVKGAHVVVSTAERNRSIGDHYYVRSDFWKAHSDIVTKFVAGYLKAVEEVLDLKKQYETKGSDRYRQLMQLSVKIYGEKVLPNEDEAHGLLSDAIFVGHPGNVEFFTNPNSLHGFVPTNDSGVQFATRLGYTSQAFPFKSSPIDWNANTFVSFLTKTKAAPRERFDTKKVTAEIEKFTDEGQIDEKTVFSFTVNFEPNQKDFSAQKYAADFNEALRLADQYAGAVLVIRGHSDPTQTLRALVEAGMKKGALRRTGSPGSYSYSFNGRPLDMNAIDQLLKLVESGQFDGVADANPRETMQAAMNLSLARANEVRDSILQLAKGKGVTIDKSQLQPQGVGIKEPFIAKPKNMDEALKNMRVEFRLVRVSAEATKPSDFDY